MPSKGRRRFARLWCRASTPSLFAIKQDVDGRDKPGHDAARFLSHLEYLRVFLLDRLGVPLDAGRIFLHQLDVGELADARLLHRLLVRGILPRVVDQNLLALAPVHPVEEQPRRVRIGRGLEHALGLVATGVPSSG